MRSLTERVLDKGQVSGEEHGFNFQQCGVPHVLASRGLTSCGQVDNASWATCSVRGQDAQVAVISIEVGLEAQAVDEVASENERRT